MVNFIIPIKKKKCKIKLTKQKLFFHSLLSPYHISHIISLLSSISVANTENCTI